MSVAPHAIEPAGQQRIMERERGGVGRLRLIELVGQAAGLKKRLGVGAGELPRHFQQLGMKAIRPIEAGKRMAAIHEHTQQLAHGSIGMNRVETMDGVHHRVGRRPIAQPR